MVASIDYNPADAKSVPREGASAPVMGFGCLLALMQTCVIDSVSAVYVV